MSKLSKIVIDTSAIINGQILKQIKSGAFDGFEIIIPNAVLDELQSQASQKKEQGIVGLEEIKKIQLLKGDFNLKITFSGPKPSLDDIRLAHTGRIDSLIKDVAAQNNAQLHTSDYAQYIVAQAQGIDAVFHKSQPSSDLGFLKYFDETTMSVHLKEGQYPLAKRGTPGSSTLFELDSQILTRDYIHEIATQLFEVSKAQDPGNIEISKPGALVIQYGDFRTAITQPPFSEKYEITIVHPIVKMSLDDYGISEKLMTRLSEQAEGILISGSPGSGKSTLASGLANFYHKMGNIVKTFESPRDLQVDSAITQYNRLDGSFENSADLLLLVRPDYTIFDEVRRKEDFAIFSDLRLTGVGMVGVVHANSPLDSIQRFIGKIELGMIPNVLDTVIFVKSGHIAKVYGLELKVKVPSGMTEQDLARPVIEISDFESGNLEYEIYTFGEENIIIPVSSKSSAVGIEKLAADRIREVFRRFDSDPIVEIISEKSVKVFVDGSSIPSIIGRNGATIKDLERTLQVHVDVEEKDGSSSPSYQVTFDFDESKTALFLDVGRQYIGKNADIFVNGKLLCNLPVGRKGRIKIQKKSRDGKLFLNQISSKGDIEVFLR